MKLRAKRFQATGLIFGVVVALVRPALGADTPKKSTEPSDEFYVQTWQEDEGLPRNTITAMTQTPDGYLWLATHFGLIRFDGVRFTTLGAEIRPELVRSTVWKLETDQAGRLWLGTGKGGILIYEKGVFRLLNASRGLPHPTVNSMCEGNQGIMWVSTGDGSISRILDGTTVECIGYVGGAKSAVPIHIVRDRQGDLWFSQGGSYGRLFNGVATNVVKFGSGLVHLCPSRDGGIWLAINRQLAKLSGSTNRATTLVSHLPFGNYEIEQLFEDHQGHLWIGTRNQGLFRRSNSELKEVLPARNRILDICEDFEGSLWVATEAGGLSKVRPRVFRTLTPPESPSSHKVLSVCEDQDGTMWAAMQVGGLVRYRAASVGPELLPESVNMVPTSVLPGRGGGIWAGTAMRGLLHYDGQNMERLFTRSPLRDRQMRVLFPDHNGEIWIALLPSGLARLDSNNPTPSSYVQDLGLPDEAISAIAEDREEALWFGTINGNLHRLQRGKLVSYTQADGLPGTAIGALHVDGSNCLWVATLGGGLGCFRSGKFRFASVAEGLRDNVISQIVEDDYGFLWFGSNRGIFRVRKRNLDQFMSGQDSQVESIPYGKSDGLANVECSGGYQPSVWKTTTGQLCFATSKGAIFFDPAALPLNSRPPPLALERVVVDGTPVSATAPIQLNWNHKTVEFSYTALSFIAPEKVHFRRQLVGFDSAWVEDGARRSAIYPRLEPGSYEFRFTACNDDGVWNEHPATLAVTVIPAWWQRSWYRGLIILGFAAAVGGLVRYFSTLTMRRRLARSEQAHALEKERSRIARDIHDDVGARLTQMAYLSELASTEIAEGSASSYERLREIVRASRQTVHALDEIVWAVNPSKDSLAHLVEYISQYANRFFRGTAIRCRQDLPVELPDWTLSSEFRHHLFLAAKEAFNNIQKHSKATEVWIRVALEGPQLRLIIEDNGEGFTMSDVNPNRDGLQNMRNRLAVLGGTCQIASQTGRGTHLVMQVVLPRIDAPPKPVP